MASDALYPDNDFNQKALLRQVNPLTGDDEPLTTGTLVGFISEGHESDDVAAESSWQVNGTYVGNEDDEDGNSCGAWIFNVDGANLTLDLLESHFGADGTGTRNRAFFVVKKEGDVRVYKQLRYFSSRRAS